MTREEAIRELEILKEDYWDDDGYGHETKQYDDTMLALDMAIKALEQEPTTKNDLGVTSELEKNSKKLEKNFGELDCISRQAVLDLIAEINALPSVTPQEPSWIPVSERLPKIADVYRVTRYYRNNVMNPNYLVDACFFDGSNWYNDNRINLERCYAFNIIAWQENPEPYEPQKTHI